MGSVPTEIWGASVKIWGREMTDLEALPAIAGSGDIHDALICQVGVGIIYLRAVPSQQRGVEQRNLLHLAAVAGK
jgi:hypothetical protein